eukprot:SAG22_NODE_134_length_18372_cov_33.054944_11_plen_673_part_00
MMAAGARRDRCAMPPRALARCCSQLLQLKLLAAAAATAADRGAVQPGAAGSESQTQSDGAHATLEPCNASAPAQQWRLRAGWGDNATLVNSALDGGSPADLKCLAVDGFAVGRDGALVSCWGCALDPASKDYNQQWFMGSSTQLRVATVARQPGKCLSTAELPPAAGAGLVLQDCTAKPEDGLQWRLLPGGSGPGGASAAGGGLSVGGKYRALALCLSTVTGLAPPPPAPPAPPAPPPPHAKPVTTVAVAIDWTNVTARTRTAATIITTVMPFAGRTEYGGPFEGYYQALSGLGAECHKFLPWFPNPKAVVTELQPPDCTEDTAAANWDSRVLDQVMSDFMTAICGYDAAAGKCTKAGSVAMQLSTIPAWMLIGGCNASELASNPWNTSCPMGAYGHKGAALRDPSCKEVAAYFGRLVGWFTQSGYNDTCGHWHESGLRYPWELLSVLHEDEHGLKPGLGVAYTTCFGAVKAEVAKINPALPLMGPEVCFPEPWADPSALEWIRYFINGTNHADGRAPPVVSYHLGLRGSSNPDGSSGHASFFSQWDRFYHAAVLQMDPWKEEIASTGSSGPVTVEFALNEFCPFVEDYCDCTGVEELCGGHAFPTGSGCPGDWDNRSMAGGDPDLGHGRGVKMNRRTLGWNAAAAVFAHGYGQLAQLGYKYVGIDQLLGGV